MRGRGHGERHDLIGFVKGGHEHSAWPAEDAGDERTGDFQGGHVRIAVTGGGRFRPYPRRTVDVSVVTPNHRCHSADNNQHPTAARPTALWHLITGGAPAWVIAEPLVDEAIGQDPHLLPRGSSAFYPAALTLSSQALAYTAGLIRRYRSTAGVKRQYIGCAGRVANGINVAHVSLVREKAGHALIGARQWIPREHIDDPVASLATGLSLGLEFRTKGQSAVDISTDVAADGIRPDFYCGDEVYGACTALRGHLDAEGQAYVLRVSSSFMLTLAAGAIVTCAQATRTLLSRKRRWEVRSAGQAPRASGGMRGPGSLPPARGTT